MDAHTSKHLESWLAAFALPEERDAMRVAMIAQYAEDPEYYGNHEWHATLDAALESGRFQYQTS